MKKLLLALVLWPLTTLGQSPPPTVSGNITTNGSDCLATTAACVTAKLSKDSGAATIQISGTWTGTISFEATTDGTNWVAINGTALNSTSAVTSTTGNGVWRFNVSANTYIHARASASVTGTAAVVISNGTGSASVGSGASPTFDSVGSGTNTTATMVCGTGCSLAPSGSGAITATIIAAANLPNVPVLISTSGPVADPGGPSYLQYNNAAGALTFNVPAGAAGLQRCYRNATGKSGAITLQMAASNTVDVSGANGSSAGTLVSGGALGDSVCLASDATNHWYAYVQSGTWTNN